MFATYKSAKLGRSEAVAPPVTNDGVGLTPWILSLLLRSHRSPVKTDDINVHTARTHTVPEMKLTALGETLSKSVSNIEC